jgi:hypothetical protein
MADFSDDVFEHKEKGDLLKAMFLVATGHQESGEVMLDAYIEKTSNKKNSRKGINSKTQLLLDRATSLKKSLTEDTEWETFLEQFKIEHGHKDQVKWLNFSPCDKFIVAISKSMVSLWQITKATAGSVCVIDTQDEPAEEGCVPMACVNEGGKVIAVHRGDLVFTIYNVNGSSTSKKETRDVVSELKQVNADFGYKKGDSITALKFRGNSVRINFKQGSDFHHIDISLADSSSSIAKCDNYGWSDISVFRDAAADE